ncbi:MAG: hypothetical protein R3208_19635 [Ketobacteraceae bacterium]|nr:hypothetical protein [Ketobacteraceae bacterium]
MIHLHCTKKLFTQLPLGNSGRFPAHQQTNGQSGTAANDPAFHPDDTAKENPLNHWHANLLTPQGSHCILFVHNATRFPVLVPDLKKADFPLLEDFFTDIFMNTLLKLGASDQLMERTTHLLAPFVCDTQCDRSVQGTINRMGQDVEHLLLVDNMAVKDLLPYSTSVWLAETLTGVKGIKDYIRPSEEMLALLS